MEGQEIPLPHGIKEIVRVWDPSFLLTVAGGLGIVALLAWLVLSFWRRRRKQRQELPGTPVDWGSAMTKLINAGTGQWTSSTNEHFYKALRQYCLGKNLASTAISGAISRSEQAVFGKSFWEFEIAVADFRQVLGANEPLSSDGNRLLLYPSETAEKRRHSSDEISHGEPRTGI